MTTNAELDREVEDTLAWLLEELNEWGCVDLTIRDTKEIINLLQSQQQRIHLLKKAVSKQTEGTCVVCCKKEEVSDGMCEDCLKEAEIYLLKEKIKELDKVIVLSEITIKGLKNKIKELELCSKQDYNEGYNKGLEEVRRSYKSVDLLNAEDRIKELEKINKELEDTYVVEQIRKGNFKESSVPEQQPNQVVSDSLHKADLNKDIIYQNIDDKFSKILTTDLDELFEIRYAFDIQLKTLTPQMLGEIKELKRDLQEAEQLLLDLVRYGIDENGLILVETIGSQKLVDYLFKRGYLEKVNDATYKVASNSRLKPTETEEE